MRPTANTVPENGSTLAVPAIGHCPGSKVLTWEQALRIVWGVVMLIGAGVVLGSLLSSTGLAEMTGSSTSARLGEPSLYLITLIAVAMAIAFSELASNTVSVAVVVPIVVPIAAAAGVTPIIPAIAAAVGGSFGFIASHLSAPKRDRLRTVDRYRSNGWFAVESSPTPSAAYLSPPR